MKLTDTEAIRILGKGFSLRRNLGDIKTFNDNWRHAQMGFLVEAISKSALVCYTKFDVFDVTLEDLKATDWIPEGR
jgi:hypothetical protein